MKNRSLAAASLVVVAGVVGISAFHAGSAPAAALSAEGGFKIDPVHTSILFGVKHDSVATFYGRFNKSSGMFNIDAADPSKSVVDIAIETESVDTANGNRDKHLKSGDFFSASEFPTITFKSKSFKKVSEGMYEVTGDLTIRGKTKSISVPVTDTGHGKSMQGKEVAGFETKFNLKRSDFGVSFMIGPALSDDVALIVSVEGGK
jgi:polyisoprenoid-binding protein YceI